MALVRQESRGAHHRTDYPAPLNEPVWRRRITVRYDPQKAQDIYEALPLGWWRGSRRDWEIEGRVALVHVKEAREHHRNIKSFNLPISYC